MRLIMGVGPSCLATAGVSIVFSFVENWHLGQCPHRQLGYFPVGARTKEKHGVELQCDFFALWSVYEPFTHI